MPSSNKFSSDINTYLKDLKSIVKLALEEDIRSGDVNALLVKEDAQAEARVIARESGIICGRPWFDEVFQQIDPSFQLQWQVEEGDQVDEDQPIVTLKGSARTALTGERAALNFLQTLSATATTARKYSAAVEDKGITILDTRKTIPGLRLAQKYAVRIGGCQNHRIGLYDAFLIKENHIAACGSIKKAVESAQLQHPSLPVEVETENLEEVTEALKAGADRIMLDNFSGEMLKQAVELINKQAEIEISGGIELEDLPRIDLNGVNYLSSGALTKHIRALDLSMRIHLMS